MAGVVKGFGGGENVKPEVDTQETLLEQMREIITGKQVGGNLVPEAVLEGYSGYYKGQLVNGTRPDISAEVTEQTAIIEQIKTALVGKTVGSNLIPEALLLGYKGWHKGQLVEGTYVPHGQYVWKKYDAQGGNFLDYVTADNETAYPDGGEQGGYWYEKETGLSGLKDIHGYSKMAVDKLTFSSDTATTKAVSHSLSEVPSVIILLSNKTPVASGYTEYVNSLITKDDKGGGTYLASNGNAIQSTSALTVTRTANTVNFNKHYYKAGVEYTLITMA